MVIDWVQFHAETGGQDVEVKRDGNSIVRPGAPALFRYELQGPTALPIMEQPDRRRRCRAIGFFHMGALHDRRARRCAASGTGWPASRASSSSAPGATATGCCEAILEAGAEFGLVQRGGEGLLHGEPRVRLGSVPAAGDLLRRRARRTTGAGCPRRAPAPSAAASPRSDIEDYYLTPWDLDYGRTIAFDHDFVGRDALEGLAEGPHRAESDPRVERRTTCGASGARS